MTLRMLYLVSVLAVSGVSCTLQNRPASTGIEGFEKLFEADGIPDIELSPALGWSEFVNAYVAVGDNGYLVSSYKYNGDVLGSVGLRIREDLLDGLGKPRAKYHLKINFDYFGGPRFDGVDKLVFDTGRADPSKMRESLAFRMYETMGVPVPRVEFATVSTDGVSLGLYVMKQVVDKRFLKDRFGSADGADDGNLYECSPPGCLLEWAGYTREGYVDKSCPGGEPCGLLQITNEDVPELNDYSDLVAFLDILNNSSDDVFAAQIEEVFDVDGFLDYLAVAVVIGDYESYLGTGQDFYLYQRPETGRFVYIPTDFNRTYGSSECMSSAESTGADVLAPVCDVRARPLVSRLLAVEDFRQRYKSSVYTILNQFFTPVIQHQWITELDDRIRASVEADSGSEYSFKEYEASLSSNISSDDKPNLLEYVENRRAYLLTVL
jgi:spore coat protein CotH